MTLTLLNLVGKEILFQDMLREPGPSKIVIKDEAILHIDVVQSYVGQDWSQIFNVIRSISLSKSITSETEINLEYSYENKIIKILGKCPRLEPLPNSFNYFKEPI